MTESCTRRRPRSASRSSLWLHAWRRPGRATDETAGIAEAYEAMAEGSRRPGRVPRCGSPVPRPDPGRLPQRAAGAPRRRAARRAEDHVRADDDAEADHAAALSRCIAAILDEIAAGNEDERRDRRRRSSSPIRPPTSSASQRATARRRLAADLTVPRLWRENPDRGPARRRGYARPRGRRPSLARRCSRRSRPSDTGRASTRRSRARARLPRMHPCSRRSRAPRARRSRPLTGSSATSIPSGRSAETSSSVTIVSPA